ncbi:vacuolar sorting protein [Multifurca ochricompacta]|uniref:Vacuolar sorting protein n=1 Tax=Multifurca ochricompacta TaxID=376703 RepID=A0AAD4MDQ8_9AGAM|nr:vacuolar sorting protein [Multifurca ochricompacta]
MSEYSLHQGITEGPINTLENVSFRSRAKEFVELHDQVQTSVSLLDSLESFLSTFQRDLSAVSGQISDLQSRSRDIEDRLKSRRKIEKPLASLISGLTLPPNLVTTILDTDVGESWIPAIADFELRLEGLKVRGRVRAARDLGEVAEGLRIVAATKLRAFFLALLQPIRASMTTNMHVMQTTVFLKYRPLYTFLLRRAVNVATEVQKAYVASARVYYETGFRRYMRSLGWIKARTTEKDPGLASGLDSPERQTETYLRRLNHARIEGPGVTLAYMADDKTHKEDVEALLRSALLVLMDNGTSEYVFVTTFFAPETDLPPAEVPPAVSSHLFSPTSLSATLPGDDALSNPATDVVPVTARPKELTDSVFSNENESLHPASRLSKEDQSTLNAIWKQIMDPALEHTKTFAQAVLDPLPPVIPLLTMIRVTEEVMSERAMTDQIEGLKKVAEGVAGGYFRRASMASDATITTICKRYVALFLCLVMLTEQNEETMIFSNLLRLRQELTRLIEAHTDKLSEASAKARARSAVYDELLQGLMRAFRAAPHHLRAQSELVYWREKEEGARNQSSQ